MRVAFAFPIVPVNVRRVILIHDQELWPIMGGACMVCCAVIPKQGIATRMNVVLKGSEYLIIGAELNIIAMRPCPITMRLSLVALRLGLMWLRRGLIMLRLGLILVGKCK